MKVVIKALLTLTCFSAANVMADKANIELLAKKCEHARQEKITPLREQAIKECVSKDRGSRDAQEKCERFYVDYGAGTRFKSGGGKERMFNDLPECLALYEAEK